MSIDKNEKWKIFASKISNDLLDLSMELEKRRYKKWRIFGLIIGIVGFSTYGLFRNWASKEVVLISSKTFDDKQFQEKSYLLAKQTTNQLTVSPEVRRDLSDMLEVCVLDVLQRPSVQNQFVQIVEQTIKSKQIKDATKESVTEIIRDEQFTKETSKYLTNSLWGVIMFWRKK